LLALVREDGESVYCVLKEFDLRAAIPWVAQNVIPF
jgi:hypothetical protein